MCWQKLGEGTNLKVHSERFGEQLQEKGTLDLGLWGRLLLAEVHKRGKRSTQVNICISQSKTGTSRYTLYK